MTRIRSVTDEQYGKIWRRLKEVAQRVEKGVIPFKDTMDHLQKIIEGTLPTEMTVGSRTYDLLGFIWEGDGDSIVGHVMVAWAKKMDANLGQDDGEYILKHQQDIPVSLRSKVVFVFPDWRLPDNPEVAYYVCWDGGRWVRDWYWLAKDFWRGNDRLLRRKYRQLEPRVLNCIAKALA